MHFCDLHSLLSRQADPCASGGSLVYLVSFDVSSESQPQTIDRSQLTRSGAGF